MNTRRMMLAAAAVAAMAMPAGAQEVIRMGGLATLEGPFAVPGQDSMRGIRMALAEFNSQVAGKRIELITASSTGAPDTAINAARKLTEQNGVQVLIGPLSGSEGIAMRDFAKTKPNVTFVNGSSGAADTTLRDPAPNFFRFNTDGAQWMAGLGEYAFRTRNYRRIALIAEDYSFPYTQAQGFMLGFCAAGGRVVHKSWVPLGNRDYATAIAGIPRDIDALLVILGGSDAINFLSQWQQAGGDVPLIGGSITVDQTVLSARGRQREAVLGMISSGPVADALDTPEWQKFVADYRRQFPDGLPSPGLFAFNYYVATKAAILALQKVNADLSDGGARFRAELATLEFTTPTGHPVKLDANRQAIGTIFQTMVAARPDGVLYNQVVNITQNVNQTFGRPQAEFLAMGSPSRTNPNCP
jgi:branched-chain amino acid transport system substrate-binding protein